MKIIEMQSAMLSNAEVQAHILAQQQRNASNAEYTKHDAGRGHDGKEVPLYTGKLRALHLVLDDVTRYLSSSANTGGDPADKNGAADAAHNLIQRLKPYSLTKTELLMILNLRPENVEQLEPLVEDVGERFSETQQLEMLAIVAEELGTDKETG